jgi:hypothetical protein
MWQKYYKIAERQLLAGKLKTFEDHALKALRSAESANDRKQIAKTVSLLSRFYIETDNPSTYQMLQRSIDCAQGAYGHHSVDGRGA